LKTQVAASPKETALGEVSSGLRSKTAPATVS
jgi:hypothetical protein